jgi:hypothetical protein
LIKAKTQLHGCVSKTVIVGDIALFYTDFQGTGRFVGKDCRGPGSRNQQPAAGLPGLERARAQRPLFGQRLETLLGIEHGSPRQFKLALAGV